MQISKDVGIELLNSIITDLHTDGFNIKKEDIKIIEFKNINSICGYTYFVGKKAYCLVINDKLLDDTKINFLKCVIYHELAHIIQYNEAVDSKIIEYDITTDEIVIICDDIQFADKLVFDNFHHTDFWMDIVDKMNRKYHLIPKITAYLNQNDLDRFLEEFFMNSRRRKNEPHIDYTISGLTLEDMLKYNIKKEYKINSLKEALKKTDIPIDHDYRDLDKYKNKGE